MITAQESAERSANALKGQQANELNPPVTPADVPLAGRGKPNPANPDGVIPDETVGTTSVERAPLPAKTAPIPPNAKTAEPVAHARAEHNRAPAKHK